MTPAVAGLCVRFLASRSGAIAAAIVARCPGLWQRVVLQPVLPKFQPATVERLRSLVPEGGDLARLMFSMALCYFERGDGASDQRSLACLRTAEFLGFEGIERAHLYRSVLAARRGDHHEAARLRAGVEADELTAAELALLQTPVPCPGRVVDRDREREPRGGVVVLCGDAAVARAYGHADGRLAWVSPRENGLTPEWLATLNVAFDEAVGDAASLALARSAGVRARTWVCV